MENIKIHKEFCPVSLSLKGQWSASIGPYCNCGETQSGGTGQITMKQEKETKKMFKTLFETVSETMKPIEELIRTAYHEGKRAGRRELLEVDSHDCKLETKGFCEVCRIIEHDADEELLTRP